MPVTIPDVAVDPAALHAAAAAMTRAAAAVSAQADTVVRTWTGLGGYYAAAETPALLAALGPVRAGAEEHQRRIGGVGTALDDFVQVVAPIRRQLDELRAQAATAPPEDEARIQQQAHDLLAALQAAEQTCAGAIRAALEQPDAPPGAGLAATVGGGLGALALRAGDRFLGSNLLQSPFEQALVGHFTGGTGDTFVLSADQLAALAADPAVRRAGEGVRLGEAGRRVTLEGGLDGYAVEIDFKKDVPGRVGGNPFDGSLGKVTTFFDAGGRFVGTSDVYDFTNNSLAVDQTNLVGGLVGARPFHLRGGIVEQQPAEAVLPKEPDAGEALGRLGSRGLGAQLGPPLLTPRPR